MERRAERGVQSAQFETITFKYIISKYKYGTTLRLCTDDHLCSIKGCRVDINKKDFQKITIPFDHNKKYLGLYRFIFKYVDNHINIEQVDYSFTSKQHDIFHILTDLKEQKYHSVFGGNN